jgi:thiamine-phosphate pyrophosphorylase
VDYIQLREKDLAAAPLAALARAMLKAIGNSPTKLLLNSRADVALATGVHGLHLTASPDELTPAQIRALYAAANQPVPIISVSCHTLAEVERARDVDLILFGPVFKKEIHGQPIAPGIGIAALQTACVAAGKLSLLALGGVTEENIAECIAAGAAGVAGIRLFAELSSRRI